MSRIKDLPASWTLQDTYDRFFIQQTIIANNSKVMAEYNSSEGKIINVGTVLLQLVNEKIRQTLFPQLIEQLEDELIRIVELTVQMAEIHNDMEQVNNYSLGFKADRKILVKLYLEKVEKQVEELVSSELVKSIRRLIDLTDYHILGRMNKLLIKRI